MNQPIATAKLWSKDFLLVIAVNFLVFTAMYMLLPTLPLYAQDMSGSQSMAGLIVGIFTLAAVAFRPWFGNLLDHTGRKNILLAGMAIFAVTTAAYSGTTLIIVLLAIRLLQGIGWSATTTATGTIASDVIPAARRAEGMAYFGMASTAAMSVGPAWGLYLTAQSGYSSLFALAAGLAALGLATACLIKGEHPAPGIGKTARRGVMIEKTAVPPSLVLLLVSFTYGGILTFLPAYAAFRGVADSGVFFTTFALALLLTRPLMGRSADKFGFSAVLLPGMLLLAAALLVLLFATSLTGFLIAAVLYGLGFGSVQPILNAIAITLTRPERRGAANATFMSAMDTGIGLGAIIWGVVAEKLGFTYIYGCSAALILLALGLYLILLHKRLPANAN
ncbi:MFS transporter|uniref:Predicted arabinose efflux permease, MFS family n=1 Tax=Dendrosporobacter quercicolus TaxID=146817 RepID=A0A1G9QFE1_9FIRM|nr:MFS transporter [Dendrosporobacter quercicolus]NSL48224.1 MFS transporter [Dendrosporobacter quercicolus DSM 1736]SDM09693.1 Predicted arabinose efflux permease, MFS family [Dendrosporobacter quercicolus]